MKLNTNPIRGTRDYLPQEEQIRDYIRTTIFETYSKYGFQKISTPIMQDIKLLTKSEGGENLSMIFKILKRGEKLQLDKPDLKENDVTDSGLRYDLTVPMARYYAHNRHNLQFPFKSIQIDRSFRAERPQKGRNREFYQCDIDIIGEPSCNAEIELIHVTGQALLNLNFTDFIIRINDRRILQWMIKGAGFKEEEVPSVCIIYDKLDKIGIKGVREELEQKQYATGAVSKFMDIIENEDLDEVANMAKYCPDEQVICDLEKVLAAVEILTEGKYKAIYDKSLVRGMGYYTGQIFEIYSPKFGSSVGGGGRYDKMIGEYTGEDIPAVGFSIGFERITDVLTENKMLAGMPERKLLALLYSEEDVFSEVVLKADELIKAGYEVSMLVRAKKAGKQLDRLASEGFRYLFVFGESFEPRELLK